MRLKSKKVLVTGADGFIGSHLVEHLFEAGCDVRAFVYYNSFNSWGWLDSLDKKTLSKIDVFPGDIRDPNNVRKAIRDRDIVFHLAALIGVPFSYHAPDSYIDTNVKGTLNVLQAGMECKLDRILVTSTSEVYGTAKKAPITERHPFQGQSPYSASKIGADRIAESFFRSFGAPVTIVRPFNTYGPRQSARAVIPTIITQLLNGNTEIKLGSLRPTRDFNYVWDICRAYISISESDKTVGEEINIATGAEASIKEIAEILIEEINPDAKVIRDEQRVRPEKSEVMRLLGSNQKIRRLTNWRPQYDIRAGLKKTVEWFKRSKETNQYKTEIYNI